MSHREQKKTVNHTGAEAGNIAMGTGSYKCNRSVHGNVSETIAQNPVATNAIEETRILCRKL
jgi:hypothetical protein